MELTEAESIVAFLSATGFTDAVIVAAGVSAATRSEPVVVTLLYRVLSVGVKVPVMV